MKIRKDDSVVVIAGANAGMSGTVLQVSEKNERVMVDGINERTRHVKGRNGEPGQKVTFFAPIHVSNVAIVDPKTGKPTKIGYKGTGRDKVRIARSSGTEIAGKAKAKVIKKSAEKPKAATSKQAKK